MSPGTSGTVEGLFQNLARGYSIQRNFRLALGPRPLVLFLSRMRFY
jgi:hypothetical protein